MNTIRQLLSSFVLLAMLTVSAVIYICPMNMPRLAMRATHAGCEGEASIQNGGFGSFDCMGTHIAEAKATIGQVPELMNLLMILTVIFVVLRVHPVADIFGINSILTRLRQFYENYSTEIKIHWESRLLRFLSLLRSSTVASLV
jgi:hypothetical protein